MKKKVLSVTRKSQRGGAIYETLVSASLNDNYDVTEYKLDAKKPKIIPYTKLRYRYQVRNISNKEQFDISIFNRAAVYAGIHNYPFKNKVLIMHHYDEFENGNRLTQKYLHDQIIQCVKNLDRLVVVADYWKDYFGQYLDKEKIKVIHNAFDIEEINEHIGYFDYIAFKKENGIPLDKIIVYASNALEVKGYKEVIKKLNPDKYFVVTSGGSDKNVVLNHLHLDTDYQRYLRLLAVSDITVILSRLTEGWNRIAHESLLCGTKVIGSGIAGFGDLLRGAGQVIFNEGKDNLQLVIEEVLKNDLIGKVGYDFAVEFDNKYFRNSWLELCEGFSL
jgi:hypothetical protein